MSRTLRKRRKTFEQYYSYSLENNYFECDANAKYIEQEKAKYYSKSNGWYSHSLPKLFRQSVNQHRRMIDKHELHREVVFEAYDGNYCMWNCKSSNSWGYW